MSLPQFPWPALLACLLLPEALRDWGETSQPLPEAREYLIDSIEFANLDLPLSTA